MEEQRVQSVATLPPENDPCWITFHSSYACVKRMTVKDADGVRVFYGYSSEYVWVSQSDVTITFSVLGGGHVLAVDRGRPGCPWVYVLERDAPHFPYKEEILHFSDTPFISEFSLCGPAWATYVDTFESNSIKQSGCGTLKLDGLQRGAPGFFVGVEEAIEFGHIGTIVEAVPGPRGELEGHVRVRFPNATWDVPLEMMCQDDVLSEYVLVRQTSSRMDGLLTLGKQLGGDLGLECVSALLAEWINYPACSLPFSRMKVQAEEQVNLARGQNVRWTVLRDVDDTVFVVCGDQSTSDQGAWSLKRLTFETRKLLVHSGYWTDAENAFIKLREALRDASAERAFSRVVFCGHFRGGSVATAIAVMFLMAGVRAPWVEELVILTFGAPCLFYRGDSIEHKEGLAHLRSVLFQKSSRSRAYRMEPDARISTCAAHPIFKSGPARPRRIPFPNACFEEGTASTENWSDSVVQVVTEERLPATVFSQKNWLSLLFQDEKNRPRSSSVDNQNFLNALLERLLQSRIVSRPEVRNFFSRTRKLNVF